VLDRTVAGDVVALIGATWAAAHALTAHVTKPLHLLGAIDIEFRGWARLDEGGLILWHRLFYEPWFLGLGVLVTLATLHTSAVPAAHVPERGGCWRLPVRRRSP